MGDSQKIVVDACCHVPNANQKGRIGFGKSACGVLVIDANGDEYEYGKYLGEKTVPEAEFEGLVFAFDKASEVLSRNKDVEVWMDSILVIRWMTKEYKLRKEHIKPIFDEANMKAQRFTCVKYFHHPRTASLAKRADQIAENEFKKHNQ